MSDSFEARYVPPPKPQPGKITVQPPTDAKGNPVCSVLHLSLEHAEDLRDELIRVLQAYMENADDLP